MQHEPHSLLTKQNHMRASCNAHSHMLSRPLSLLKYVCMYVCMYLANFHNILVSYNTRRYSKRLSDTSLTKSSHSILFDFLFFSFFYQTSFYTIVIACMPPSYSSIPCRSLMSNQKPPLSTSPRAGQSLSHVALQALGSDSSALCIG